MNSPVVQTPRSASGDSAGLAQEVASVSPLQCALLDIWPDIDVLPFDRTDPAAVDHAVRSNETGDTLFNFVWLEMADLRGDDLEVALKAIRRGADDLSTVADALEQRLAPGSSPSF